MSIQKWSSFEDIVDFSDFWRFLAILGQMLRAFACENQPQASKNHFQRLKPPRIHPNSIPKRQGLLKVRYGGPRNKNIQKLGEKSKKWPFFDPLKKSSISIFDFSVFSRGI